LNNHNKSATTTTSWWLCHTDNACKGRLY
jgi:hypothetical protein